MAGNTLYFGDNLKILRDNLSDGTVDLIYLDPPWGSSPTVRKGLDQQANYNLLFRSPKGHESHAQITAFEDTWHWGEQAEAEFTELINQPNSEVSQMMDEYE
jgi:site-specific DNA-methyltransferase (adenine-specific)